jgi:hypothetical protein
MHQNLLLSILSEYDDGIPDYHQLFQNNLGRINSADTDNNSTDNLILYIPFQLQCADKYLSERFSVLTVLKHGNDK